MKISVTPTYDSANSSPPEVSFSESQNDNVYIELQDPPRQVTIHREDFDRIAILFMKKG